MQQGIFEKTITVTPDYCDAAAQLSPLAAFTIFQGIAAQHAELIGVGGAAMAKRGEFWLTVHTRVDFLQRAGLMDELTAATWPEPCDGKAIRCYRSYSLHRGDTLLALGRTQWAVLGPERKLMQFAQTGFPADFPFDPEDSFEENTRRRREIHRNNLFRLREAGDRNIHFIDGCSLYGEDFSECSSDNCHSSDLGFYRTAHALAPELRRILEA